MRRAPESGQAQLLTSSVIAGVMLTAAIFSLEQARKTTEVKIRSGQKVEMRAALDFAVKRASALYRDEAGCDPVILNRKLSRLNPDGSGRILPGNPGVFPSGGTAGNRQIRVPSRLNNYVVSFGQVTTLSWAADPTLVNYADGFPQDAVIEVWTSFANARVVQRAVLINTCTYPCSSMYASSLGDDAATIATSIAPCTRAFDPAISYHTAASLAGYPAAPGVPTCLSGVGSRTFGDLNDTSPANGLCTNAPDGVINVMDVVALRNYLRSGDWAGSCAAYLTGGLDVTQSCADLNRDTLVNETDLNILEKFLRGYLYWLPVNAQTPI